MEGVGPPKMLGNYPPGISIRQRGSWASGYSDELSGGSWASKIGFQGVHYTHYNWVERRELGLLSERKMTSPRGVSGPRLCSMGVECEGRSTPSHSQFYCMYFLLQPNKLDLQHECIHCVTASNYSYKTIL